MLQQGCRPEELMALESRDILVRRMGIAGRYVFPGKTHGTHMTKLNKHHGAILQACGLAFVLYDFRHTFATRLSPRPAWI
jgi:integrase